MSTTTAHRGVGERLDDVQEAVSSRFADFAYAWGKRIGIHLCHVAFFVVVVLKRDSTVLRLTGWLRGQVGTAVAGMPDTMLGLWAQGFDGTWDAISKVLGL